MSIRVANLANLFWDNGSYKYPNTYPKLVEGRDINKTPVMTSPTSGWVVLEGDYNYCQFNGDLFFLKKGSVISHKKNKWIYILIKDHICSIFKNKANVIARGTIINADVKQLKGKDFQFTYPVFNSYNHRILVPLSTEKYNWRRHSTIKEPTIKFDWYSVTTDKQFSEFIKILENNLATLIGRGKQWNNEVKKNKQLVLLGKLGAGSAKQKGWKNELVDKIKQLLEDIRKEERTDIVLGKVSGATNQGATKLNGKWAISYMSQNPLFTVTADEDSREIDIDLSGLTDIELINLDNVPEGQQYAKDSFNLYLKFDQNLVIDEGIVNGLTTFICKLSRRVRLPFLHPYTTRALFKRSDHLMIMKWSGLGERASFFYPQKIFFEINSEKALRPLDKYATHYPQERYTKAYRSVYLYWCFNLDFYFVWGSVSVKSDWYTPYKNYSKKDHWMSEEQVKQYFQRDSVRQWIHKGEQFLDFKLVENVQIIPSPNVDYGKGLGEGSCINQQWMKEYYSSFFPWTRGGDSDAGEPINIGWLLGQFSTYIKGQDGQFESEYPYIVKTGVVGERSLKRLKGFKEVVSKMIGLTDIYSNARTGFEFTLDLFDYLPNRTLQKAKEEDFLIGEKMLTTCWGMAPWLLFQPIKLEPTTQDRYGTECTYYGYFYEDQTLGNWLNSGSWDYAYYVFDSGSYFTTKAKQSYKTVGERGLTSLSYKRFYQTPTNYKELKKNIVNNTEKYFQIEEVTFKNTTLKELKIGDVFYSDDEWFWFNQSREGFGHYSPNDFFAHQETTEPQIEHSPPVKLQLKQDDLVAYLNPKDNKLYLGKVYTWDNDMELPVGQFIAKTPDDDSSNVNIVKTRYTRITPTTGITQEARGYESLQVLIDSLKSQRFLKQLAPVNLKQLQDLGRDFLFNLKGTAFWCLHDRLGRVSLIYKNKEQYEETEHVEE